MTEVEQQEHRTFRAWASRARDASGWAAWRARATLARPGDMGQCAHAWQQSTHKDSDFPKSQPPRYCGMCGIYEELQRPGESVAAMPDFRMWDRDVLERFAMERVTAEVNGPLKAPDLQDTREHLLTPREIVRADMGMLYHPALPIADEGTRYDLLLAAFGLDSAFVSMESQDTDGRLEEAYAENETCIAWTPSPPTGEGWLLIEIYDTEDGPYALFVRDVKPAVWNFGRQVRSRPAGPTAEEFSLAPAPREIVPSDDVLHSTTKGGENA